MAVMTIVAVRTIVAVVGAGEITRNIRFSPGIKHIGICPVSRPLTVVRIGKITRNIRFSSGIKHIRAHPVSGLIGTHPVSSILNFIWYQGFLQIKI